MVTWFWHYLTFLASVGEPTCLLKRRLEQASAQVPTFPSKKWQIFRLSGYPAIVRVMIEINSPLVRRLLCNYNHNGGCAHSRPAAHYTALPLHCRGGTEQLHQEYFYYFTKEEASVIFHFWKLNKNREGATEWPMPGFAGPSFWPSYTP